MSETFDAEAERSFVRAVLANRAEAMDRFSERLRCVPAILKGRNARLGRPLQPAEVEDLIQETLVLILQKLPRYEPRAPLESWMFGFCCVQFRNALRRKQRLHARVGTLGESAVSDERAEREMERFAERDRIHASLEALHVDETIVVRLKHFEGLTLDEVGRRLGLSPNTVRTRYYRALTKLRELLGPSP